MVKLDRNSHPIWSYLQPTHHDFDVGADGRIYALTDDFTSRTLKGFEFLDRPRLSDALVVLSPEGRPLQKIPLTEALARSRYRRLLYSIPQFSLADPLHTNAVQVIDGATAAHFPRARPGEVLLSFRDLGAVVVLDPERGTLDWLLRGAWLGQHDPQLLPDGHLLMFDNLGGYERDGGRSQVLEVDPATHRVTWRYRGDARHPLDSELRGAVEREPNGNTLITDSDAGRLVEVTPDGQIVWEYFNPARGGDRAQYIPILCWGQRIDPQTLDPDFRALLAQRSQRSDSP